jgi:hypothetical protein
MSIMPDHGPIAPAYRYLGPVDSVPYDRPPDDADQLGTIVSLRVASDTTGVPVRAILGAVGGGEVRAFRRRFTIVVVLEDVKKLTPVTRKTPPAVAR